MMKRKGTVIVIPARYGSTRFPAKALANLCGKPMIQHTYDKAAASSAEAVYVATDHEKIRAAVENFGGHAIMTSPDHPSGTDRIYEAVRDMACDIVVNVQGDEPLIPTSVIDEVIELMNSDPAVEMATVAVKLDRKLADNPNRVKVVTAADGRALYFSRAPIPFLREGGDDMNVYLHWGLYAYRKTTLAKFVSLPPSPLERCEKLEQLRALENGIGIRVLFSDLESIGVDTPADLARAEQKLRNEA